MSRLKLIFLLTVVTFIFSCTERISKNEKPNILFIFADDQTYSSIHALGNKEIITPNLDKLANSGVTFTHTYNMGAWHGAVCVASRAMLNTGRFVWHIKDMAEKGYPGFKEGGMFWSQMMEKAGYDTYITGKWHVNFPADSIFQNVSHIRPGMPPTVEEAYNRPQTVKDSVWLPWDVKNGGYWQGGKHWSEVVGDDAVSFINLAQNSQNPFFMYVAFNAPHDPRQSPKEFVEMYPMEKILVPESFREMYPYKDSIGCGPDLRDERLAPFPRTRYSVKVHRQEYYAIITHLDQQIGRIINHLKKTGMDKNTYILFSADHGLAVGNHGLIGKQNMYDHSMRVPCILVGPGIPENEKREMQVYLQDLMATSLELAEIEKPDYVEFNSLLPLISNASKKSPYPEIYGTYMNLQRMIRTDKYKLIVYPKAKVIRLYDVENDPLEINDLAQNPGYSEIVKNLLNRLENQQKTMNDTLNLKYSFPAIL
jgi:arylsulfatase A-like enzyme